MKAKVYIYVIQHQNSEGVNNGELPPRVENWIFESPLLYIRTFTEGGNHIPSSRTERAIFEKELL